MRVTERIRSWVPRWWRGEERGAVASVLAIAVTPAEAVFRFGVHLRNSAYDRGIVRTKAARAPVISIGNITVGGTGKTPFCAWVAGRLLQMGELPGIVLRGYGQDELEVHRELNPRARVTASPRRIDGIERALKEGASCIVLDDGFQHRAVARDVDIVLISAESWSRNRHLIPRGPYREPLTALARASHVMVTRKTASSPQAKSIVRELGNTGLSAAMGIVRLSPLGLERIDERPSGEAGIRLEGRRVVALTSLADPGPFEEHLRQMGATVERLSFPDHHDFDDADLRSIQVLAKGDPVVMTLKEAVKLRARWPAEVVGLVLTQEVVVEEGLELLVESISRAVKGFR